MSRDVFPLSKRRLRENAKFNALSPSEKWYWLNLCLFLDDQDEAGVTRWDLDRLARALYCPVEALRSLAAQDVLKGASAGESCKPYIHVDRRGEEHTLIPAQPGPVWYASAIVRDEYLRQVASKSGSRGGGSPLLRRNPDTIKGASKGVPKGAPKGVASGPPAPASSSSPTPLSPTPPTSPVSTAGAAAVPVTLATAEFLDAWAEWLRHRREKRQTLTPTAARRQLAKLAGMGPARAIAAIHHSVANGYQGIFEPSDQQQKGPHGTHSNPHRRLNGRPATAGEYRRGLPSAVRQLPVDDVDDAGAGEAEDPAGHAGGAVGGGADARRDPAAVG